MMSEYFFYLLLLCVQTQAFAVQNGGCEQKLNKNKFVDGYEVIYKLEINPNNISDYNLTATVFWSLKSKHFFGHLYKFFKNEIDKDGGELDYSYDDYYDSTVNSEVDINACNGLSYSKIVVPSSQDSDNITQCPLPCSTILECLSQTICNKIAGMVFERSLYKTTKSMTFPIEFATEYGFTIAQYTKEQMTEDQFVNVQVYCRDFLVKQKINFTSDVAKTFCDIEQKGVFISPPYNVEVCQIKDDFTTNKAIVTLTWKAPLDISRNVTFRGFLLYNTAGILNTKILKASETCHLFNDTNVYCATISDVTYLSNVTLTVTTRYAVNDNAEQSGERSSIKFSVRDVQNACVSSDTIPSFCAENATCVDNAANYGVAASCSCKEHYRGNGINQYWGGGGCEKIDNCENSTCGTYSTCHALYNSTKLFYCKCIDGYQQFTGSCLSKALIVILLLSFPLAIFFTVTICFLHRKIRTNHKRKLYKLTSRFIVSDSVKHNFESESMPSSVVSSNFQLNDRDIVFGDIIGRGCFGVVNKATFHASSGTQTVALKTITNVSLRNEFLSEIFLLFSLRSHENIVSTLGYICTEARTSLVMEFLKHGDLLHFLWRARQPESESDTIYQIIQSDAVSMARQIANGMSYLKRMKIIHGDLAARNILVGEKLTCKISDFGLANDVYKYGSINGSIERKIPYKWISPERMSLGVIPITWRSDVWSLGVLLYEIYTLGGTPYAGVSNEDLLDLLKTGQRLKQPSSCSCFVYDIMHSCWEWIPSKRPSFEQLAEELKSKKLFTNGSENERLCDSFDHCPADANGNNAIK